LVDSWKTKWPFAGDLNGLNCNDRASVVGLGEDAAFDIVASGAVIDDSVSLDSEVCELWSVSVESLVLDDLLAWLLPRAFLTESRLES